jgi:hypothetical protein
MITIRFYRLLTSFTLILLSFSATAQLKQIPFEVNWLHHRIENVNPDPEGTPIYRLGDIVDGYHQRYEQLLIPYYSFSIPTHPFQIESVSLRVLEDTLLDLSGSTGQRLAELIETQQTSRFESVIVRKKFNGEFHCLPVYKKNGRWYRILRAEFTAEYSKPIRQNKLAKKSDDVFESKLSTGEWYRLSIIESGVHAITSDVLQSMGVDGATPVGSIHVYGNGGAMLEEPLDDNRKYDLNEIPVKVRDLNQNGILDGDDQLLFFAEGPHLWTFNSSTSEYEFRQHTYSDKSHVFVKVGGLGSNLNTLPASQGENELFSVNTYDYLWSHEMELENLVGSGRQWYGESFTASSVLTVNTTLPGFPVDNSVSVEASFLSRALSTSFIDFKMNSNTVSVESFSRITGNYVDAYATGPKGGTYSLPVSGQSIQFTADVSSSDPNVESWLDYIRIQAELPLSFNGGQLLFGSNRTAVDGWVKYNLTGSPDEVWWVSDVNSSAQQLTVPEGNGRAFWFNHSNQPERFVAFNYGSVLIPEFVEKVENQNVHGVNQVDYVIVSHPDYLDQANRLAEFHKTDKGITTLVVTNQQVFNEFSSGTQDVTAIRDMMKVFYDRAVSEEDIPTALLLFGDASYDFKDKVNNNTNRVPIYQSFNSIRPTRTHCSDDYYVILDDGEGFWGVSGKKEGLDIGVGRIPATNLTEATILVDKIIQYHAPSTFGSWRNNLMFVGDDEDSNTHLMDVERATAFILDDHKQYNVDKVYLDAYEQTSFGSGDKYPEVNNTIDRRLEDGLLVFNYIGHGGGQGMAHERIVTRSQIRAWEHDQFPLMVTATCELARFDDPLQDSPGELALFNNSGGAIALVTTTRVVYIGSNSNLNNELIDQNLLARRTNGWPSLGEIYRKTKNESSVDHINQRNFILLGDPMMQLAYPDHNVVTTSINGVAVGSQMDTLRALSKVTVTGRIEDASGSTLTSFNGTIYPTVYDKFLDEQTLGNDPGSVPFTYQEQTSVLYRGAASVTNGLFEFEFILPKDIAYQVGEGKISYYANNESSDANGFENRFLVGETADSFAIDETGPQIQLWLEDTTFVEGGITSTQPLIIARFFDEHGINTVGSGIGREIEAIIDKNTESEQRIVLNDFYRARKDDFRSGDLEYKLANLAPGKHTIQLKAWDVYNNSSVTETWFEVPSDEELRIEHVLNYPNPFTTHTRFHFDHNRPGETLQVAVNIMTVTGKVVKRFYQQVESAPNHVELFDWDGLDDFGSNIGRGAYVYKLEVSSENGGSTHTYQKLYLLR